MPKSFLRNSNYKYILIILGFVVAGACNVLAMAQREETVPDVDMTNINLLTEPGGIAEVDISQETPGWAAYQSKQMTLEYPSEINLRTLEARLRSRSFSVSTLEKDLFANPAYAIEKRIIARLETILLRVEQILAMSPRIDIKIKVFRTRAELNNEYWIMFKETHDYKSFYVDRYKTIYTSLEDISDSVISHEMGHAIIDSYFSATPPPKVAELLATYVDEHLDDSY
ncbi:MAG: hypothetical protein HQL24_03080 [Candidatus Omnitrophica bacterium]|nr:hypothetical protein [Candidatus Omnitrophota bacterium]